MSKHTVEGAIESLNRKNDVIVNPNITGIGGTIHLLHGNKAKGDVGIGSKGKIAFLENHHGYRKEWTDDFKTIRN
jgi:hypothetical protein